MPIDIFTEQIQFMKLPKSKPYIQLTTEEIQKLILEKTGWVQDEVNSGDPEGQATEPLG